VDTYLANVRKSETEGQECPTDAVLEHLHRYNYKSQLAVQHLRHDRLQATPADIQELDAMTAEDIAAFEKAIDQVGKSFHEIHSKMDGAVPVATLILYYFTRWKGSEAFAKWKTNWNQRVNNETCYVCGEGACSADNQMLCCDKCPQSYHMLCLDPPMAKDAIPDGSWFCKHCRLAKEGSKKGAKKDMQHPFRPVKSWKEGTKLEVQYEEGRGQGQWYNATIVMKSKKQIKIAYDGWDQKFNEWIKKTSSRIAPPGEHIADKSKAPGVPAFARPIADAENDKIKSKERRNCVKKTSKILIENLADNEARYARECVRAAKGMLRFVKEKGKMYTPVQPRRREEDGTSSWSGGDDTTGTAPSFAARSASDGDGSADDSGDETQLGSPRSTGPTIEELKELLERIASIPAHITQEAELMTLHDRADEWLYRAGQFSVTGKATRKTSIPHVDSVEALLRDAKHMPVEFVGASLLRSALDEATVWVLHVEEIGNEHVPDQRLRDLIQAGPELKVLMPEAEILLTKLQNKLRAQELDVDIQKARQQPTPLKDLQDLCKRASAVNSTTTAFQELEALVHGAAAWHKRATSALRDQYSCSIDEMQALIEEGVGETNKGIVMTGVDELRQAVASANKWLEAAADIDWTSPTLNEFRSLMKVANQLQVKAKIDKLVTVCATIKQANAWLSTFRRLVPKRVNKKSLDSLFGLEDLQKLLEKAQTIGVQIDETQQLVAQMQSGSAVIDRIKAKLAEPIADEAHIEEQVSSLKDLLKEGERTPVLIAELKDLRNRIKGIEFQEQWEMKVDEAMSRDQISEVKLDALLQDSAKLLVQDCEELIELKQIAAKLSEWKTKVVDTINSKEANRIAVLESLLESSKDLGVDMSNNELMEMLQESLKTYCICGGKDDDTFMIQCEDCEDWFHGRCVNVQEFKDIECTQQAVEEMVFICPRCCERKGEKYRFANDYAPPTDQAAQERCCKARARRVQLMKQRRLERSQPDGERKTKKHKVSIQDAENFVENIKLRFAQSPQKYDQFLKILQQYASQERSIEAVYESISTLFAGHEDLQTSFVCFLPKKMQQHAKECRIRAQKKKQPLASNGAGAPDVHLASPVNVPTAPVGDAPAELQLPPPAAGAPDFVANPATSDPAPAADCGGGDDQRVEEEATTSAEACATGSPGAEEVVAVPVPVPNGVGAGDRTHQLPLDTGATSAIVSGVMNKPDESETSTDEPPATDAAIGDGHTQAAAVAADTIRSSATASHLDDNGGSGGGGVVAATAAAAEHSLTVGLKRKRPDDDDGETVEDTDTAEHLSAGAVVPLKVARVETEVAAADVAAAAAGVAAAAATAAPATLVIEEPPLNVQEGVTMATEEPPVGMETTSYNNAMNEPRAEQAIQTASAGGGTSAAPDSASGP
jgi:hypothetical protein